MWSPLLCPAKEISGTVSSEDGSPLAGATVTVKGSKIATSTGANGSFKLSVPGKSDIIVASFTNYVSKEIAVGNLSTFNIILKPATAELENVVVTVLGFQEKADKFGTASSKIGAPEVVRSGETGLLQGMAGKASGFQSPGQPVILAQVQTSESGVPIPSQVLLSH